MAAQPEMPLYLETNGRHPKWMERRKRVRMQVHWTIRFLRNGNDGAHETVTRDLSSEGFQCLTKMAFVPGESAACTLGVPANDPKDARRMLMVNCKVRVVWVRATDDGYYDMGCRIENYRFIDASSADPKTIQAESLGD